VKFTSIVEPVGNSTFHAVQFSVNRRFANGFSILANYQYGKSIDDASANKGTGVNRTNPFDQSFDKGRSDFDRTHVFNFSGLWELPVRFHNRLQLFGRNRLLFVGALTVGGIAACLTRFC